MTVSRRKFMQLSALGFASSYLFGCNDNSSSHGSYNGGGEISLDADPFIIPNYNENDPISRFAAIGDVHSNCSLLDNMLSKCELDGIPTVLLIGDSAESFYQQNDDGSLMYPNYPKGEPQGYKEFIMEQQGWDRRLDIYPTRGNHCVKMDHQIVSGLTGKTIVVEGKDGYIEMQRQWHETVGQYLNGKSLIKPSDYYEYATITDTLSEKLEQLVSDGLHDDSTRLYNPATYAFIKDGTLFISLDTQFTMGWATLNREDITSSLINTYLVTDQNLFNNSYRDLGNEPFDPITITSDGKPIYVGCEWMLLFDFIKVVMSDYKGQYKNVVTFYHFPMCGRNHGGQLHNISPTAFLSSGNSPLILEEATELLFPLVLGIFGGDTTIDLGDYTMQDIIDKLTEIGYGDELAQLGELIDEYGNLVESALPAFLSILKSLLADFGVVLPSDMDNYAKGFTKDLLEYFAENNIVHLCGHDHIFSKSNIYAVGADTIKSPSNGVDYTPYAIAEKNNVGDLAKDIPLNNLPHFKAFTVDSGSHKHYTTQYAFSAPGFEIPLFGQSTNRSVSGFTQDDGDAVVNGMMIGEFRGDLLSLTEIANEHSWTNDGFIRYLRGEISLEDLETLDINNWKTMSATLVFKNAETLIVPPNFSYETNEIPSSNGSIAKILAGNNTTYNSAVGTKLGRLDGENTLGYPEEVNIMWLESEHGAVVSDVLFIEGMVEQNGAEFDNNGNVTNGLSWYVEDAQYTDPFYLSISAGKPLTSGCKLAIYDELNQCWIALDSEVSGNALVSAGSGINQNGFFAIVDFDLLDNA